MQPSSCSLCPKLIIQTVQLNIPFVESILFYSYAEENPAACDVLIVYGKDAGDWCQYLQSLFHSCQEVQNYLVETGTAISMEELDLFNRSKCIIILLSSELVQNFYIPAVLQSLQNVLQPPHKVVKLFCGVSKCETYKEFFEDWSQWKQLSYDDDDDVYIAAVMKAISEGDSGCDSVTDAEVEDDRDLQNSCNITTNRQHGTRLGNLIAVQPDRIRCGVQTIVYMILKCKLDSQVKMEVEFSSDSCQPVRVQARMENEYTVSVCTPGQRDEELPTLLHFSAKYGLKNLTALLLTCPGALQAYSVANKHGFYPNNLAEKHGFKDLRQFIDEYVETADMLKCHIKEELMQGKEDDSVYESMAHLSTDLLMKCSLNPDCDEELYESMAGMVPSATEDLSVASTVQYQEEPQMVLDTESEGELHDDVPVLTPQVSSFLQSEQARDWASDVEMLQSDVNNSFSQTTKDYMMRKFLEGVRADVPEPKEDIYHTCEDEEVYHIVEQDNFPQELVNRPPVPVPRPDPSLKQQDKQSYIYKVFAEKKQLRPGNLYVSAGTIRKEAADIASNQSPTSIYDPFAGMKTPGQRQLITLQEQVKLGMLTVDEAVLCFKEWQLNQKRRSESFRFQQENLKRLRESITRRQIEKQRTGKRAGSSSNRSSTRSILSISSGMDGDNEDNEMPEVKRSFRSGTQPVGRPPTLPPGRPPRIPPRVASRPLSSDSFHAPPVPPRGREMPR
ncbi:hypothetical protein JD844_031757 [Phrynosoma platyrhinos]|uniref:Phosphoinositide-3-kinase adaptor protein 1 n=1 Tax=Phrynosoma platyrhinos TaxID=52577 RepID=A0ABQ7T499_PHRPL|nr:hypothetical protein JD844_031757 [Phrynosoma platyrhinos]